MIKVNMRMKKTFIYLVHCSQLESPHVEEKISLLPCEVPTSAGARTSYGHRGWGVLGERLQFTPETIQGH